MGSKEFDELSQVGRTLLMTPNHDDERAEALDGDGADTRIVSELVTSGCKGRDILLAEGTRCGTC